MYFKDMDNVYGRFWEMLSVDNNETGLYPENKTVLFPLRSG
jgi:hypothetical protein